MKTISRADAPIAVFDSGVGGLSVLKTLRRVLPSENFIYYGDSANAPYGEKTAEEVKKAAHNVTRTLLSYGAKAIVIACNTATSAAAEFLRSTYPDVPIIGMEPAVKPAALSAPHPTVLVMATPLTLREAKFRSLIDKYKDDITLPVVFDWEVMDYRDSRTKFIDIGKVTTLAKRFCALVEEEGYETGIYFNRHDGYDYDLARIQDKMMWFAGLQEYPNFYYRVDMWQYSFSGVVDGVPGEVDLDMIFTEK